MELLGDLERFFASAIYPNRVLVGLVGVLVVVALAIVAARRRWDLAARRHPRATLVGAVAAIALLGPIVWYLGSPLVLSNTIDEPPPVVAADSSTPPGTSPSEPVPTEPGATPQASPTAAPAPSAPLVELSGTFTGADEFHFGEGTARLIETAPGSFTVRLEDFAVRNGPDLFVYLSPSPAGDVDGAVDLGALKADRGNQNYEVPAGIDVTSVRSVVIWCKQFSVLFATAPLS